MVHLHFDGAAKGAVEKVEIDITTVIAGRRKVPESRGHTLSCQLLYQAAQREPDAPQTIGSKPFRPTTGTRCWAASSCTATRSNAR